MKEIGIQELRFELSEIDCFFATYDIRLSHSELNLLEEAIDGWAAGLRFIFDSCPVIMHSIFAKLAADPVWDNQKLHPI